MASKVDFPQPEGPEIERYSPFFTSKWMLCRACVSTSSVTKTLLTASSRISGCEPFSIVIYPFYDSRETLVQLNSVVAVVGRHVRENDPVSHLQPFLDFDGAHGAAPEHHLHLVGVLPARFQLEDLHCAVLLPEDRPVHEDHVIQPLQLDRPVHTQVGPQHARRWRVLAHNQRHVHRHRAVQNRGIDARNLAFHQTITCVDHRALTDYDIFY